jgi:DNA-binding NarL/FixJ family response regulator
VSVVGVASTIADALARVEELRPDVTLLDINLGDESGFELAARLHDGAGVDPGQMILISTRAEDDYADLIAASPAIGFLSKSRLSAHAIRDLLDGRAGGGHAAPVSEPPGT